MFCIYVYHFLGYTDRRSSLLLWKFSRLSRFFPRIFLYRLRQSNISIFCDPWTHHGWSSSSYTVTTARTLRWLWKSWHCKSDLPQLFEPGEFRAAGSILCYTPSLSLHSMPRNKGVVHLIMSLIASLSFHEFTLVITRHNYSSRIFLFFLFSFLCNITGIMGLSYPVFPLLGMRYILVGLEFWW